jgi:serine/threonine protein kinase
MEYVQGTPIDAACAQVELRDRLAVFLRVCEGVSHAHGRLIIHRDLKPSNILVDITGQPKVLDFGIAKLLDNADDATRTGERLLTPNYASPEQLRGEPQTTASDIYSLGAVLWKLVTSQSPRESQANPALNPPQLPADLGFILRKSMRAEAEERYTSVEALANDIRALLASRPVEARSGSAWYRTRKFVRRNRVPVIAALLVIASLVLRNAGLHWLEDWRIRWYSMRTKRDRTLPGESNSGSRSPRQRWRTSTRSRRRRGRTTHYGGNWLPVISASPQHNMRGAWRLRGGLAAKRPSKA